MLVQSIKLPPPIKLNLDRSETATIEYVLIYTLNYSDLNIAGLVAAEILQYILPKLNNDYSDNTKIKLTGSQALCLKEILQQTPVHESFYLAQQNLLAQLDIHLKNFIKDTPKINHLLQ